MWKTPSRSLTPSRSSGRSSSGTPGAGISRCTSLSPTPTGSAVLLVVDPLGAVPDGGEEALGRALTARLSPADAARAQELDDRALAGEGSVEDAIEALRLVWPYYFAHPESAPPMPAMELSVECYADTVASIREHFDRGTLVDGRPGCDIPAVFVLGRESPIPYSEGVRTAELMQQARVEILDGCGHFPWLEQPGSALAVAATLPNG